MKHFFYIERTQQWINILKIVTIYRVSTGWNIIMEGGVNVGLYDSEYEALNKMLSEPPHKPEDKQD